MNAHDRCDSCSAQAVVEVRRGDQRLMFCGHHYHQHHAALTAQGFEPVEEEELTPA
jgi:hypothetical protein